MSKAFLSFNGFPEIVQIIPIRSRQTYSKQVCLWDLAQIICITFIIQIVSAIWFFVAKTSLWKNLCKLNNTRVFYDKILKS